MNQLLFTFTLIVVMLFCSVTATGIESAELDSLDGIAEIQRAGKNDWTYLKVGEKVNNNDVVRVLDKSFARLKWPDGSVVYIHKNTQILINILTRKSNTVLTHSTVLFGAAFFVIKKILPKEFSNDTRVYTPTAVISIRGTSFLVTVDKETKTSSVKMINGTVLIGNIKKNVSIFLTAPFKTRLTADTDPIVPSALLEADLDSLKQWVPPPVIDGETAAHIAKTKRDQVILSGKLDDKCIVVPFTNISTYSGNWVLKNEIPKMLIKKLKVSHPAMNIAFVDSVDSDHLITAFQHKARYLITGTIEMFDIIQRAEISARADDYREIMTGIVKIKLEIVDAFDKKVISQENIIGEVSRKNKTENTWDNLKNVEFNLENKEFAQSMIGMALQQALEQAIEKCDATLGL